MTIFQIFRETALPSTLQPSSVYFIAPPSKPNYIELYVTDSTGTIPKRIIREEDIQVLIDSKISEFSSIEVVADIAERDSLNPSSNIHVYVLDASSDPTVNVGSASYIYQQSTDTWHKFSESESLEINLSFTWSEIIGKPSSSPSQIDTSVANSHTHANKTQLDKIDENVDGNFTYNGQLPLIEWTTVGW